jgi:1-deoxy-D-xylulose-5-phosphate reductoisomerase
LPIQYALTYPERMECPMERLKITDVSPLEFFPPSFEKFPCLGLAYEAAQAGGTMPAVLNAANEVAVEQFLERKLRLSDIPSVIRQVMSKHTQKNQPTLDDIFIADKWARECAAGIQRSQL